MMALALVYHWREANGRIYSQRRIHRRAFRYCRRFMWRAMGVRARRRARITGGRAVTA
jgi:hypothetical protein